jgi:hypothetical protein
MAELTTQVLKDTSDALIVKWVNVANTGETHTEKVNCAALVAAVHDLTTDGNSAISLSDNGWVPGETVVGNTSGVQAQVVAWNYTSNVLSVTHLQANGSNTAFANGESVRGLLSNSHFLLASQTEPNRSLDIESLWFTISPNGRVAIEWEGLTNASAAYVTAAALFDTGYFGKNELATLFVQPAVDANTANFSPNGSISVTTAGMGANGGYTIVAEFRKGNGFSSIPDSRFRDK